ncbi:MAG: A/G-specific adenine glycosylase [Reichenbachiella sp.]
MNYRDLPWRSTKDPFRIWLSEIILQQTRVVQGLPYYEKFIQRFENVYEFADASESEILKLWQGLGYYSRARNMHTCASEVVTNYDGRFPDNYIELLKLKGIGKYTAAAIASICFNEKIPVIDGNVYRVISRLFGLSNDISSSQSYQIFFDAMLQLMPEENCGDFNQSVMELGATICSPSSPSCDRCPISTFCFAYAKNTQLNYPVKTKKVKISARKLDYHILQHKNMLLMSLRSKKDIWKGLHEFFLVENENNLKLPFSGYLEKQSEVTTHQLTHQKLSIQFHRWNVSIDIFDMMQKKFNMKSIDISEIGNFAVPKPIELFLKNENLLVN